MKWMIFSNLDLAPINVLELGNAVAFVASISYLDTESMQMVEASGRKIRKGPNIVIFLLSKYNNGRIHHQNREVW